MLTKDESQVFNTIKKRGKLHGWYGRRQAGSLVATYRFQGNFTLCLVRMFYGTIPREACAIWMSKRSPRDGFNPEIGMRVALRMALENPSFI